MLRYSQVLLQTARDVCMKFSPQLCRKAYKNYKQYKNYNYLTSHSMNDKMKTKLILSALVSGLSALYLGHDRKIKNGPRPTTFNENDLTNSVLKYLGLKNFIVLAQNGRVPKIDLPLPFEDEYEEVPRVTDPVEVMRKYLQETSEAYDKAIKLCDLYNTKIEVMMNRCPDGCIDHEPWMEIENIAAEKFEAEMKLKELVRRIDDSMGPEAEVVRSDLESRRVKYQQQKERAEITSKFWFKVTKGRETFVSEMEALFPKSHVARNVICGIGGDIDALLLIAMRKICQLQNEIASVDCELHSRLSRCLENKVDCKVLQEKIECELKKERLRLESFYKRKMMDNCTSAQERLSKKLKLAEIDYEKCLHRTLAEQTEKVLSEERRKEAEYTATHRLMMDQKMKIVLDRLSELDLALKARSDADKMSQQAQKLWIAAEMLDETLKGRSVRNNEMRTCIGKELDAIRDSAADSDELVKVVLGGVTPTVRSKGVLTESVLRHRFVTVEKACRDFALVPEGARGLPQILLSKLANYVVMRPKISPLAPKTDDTLDNYEIIEKVRKYVEEGQWDQVYHYMKLLKGGAHDVSKDWLNEVSLHLQVRLVSDAIQAHAAAIGLLKQ